ncbi:MAG: LysM peptidoglycan-binding domain-containing protein [Candidatus Promineifilaceae bacterium]
MCGIPIERQGDGDQEGSREYDSATEIDSTGLSSSVQASKSGDLSGSAEADTTVIESEMKERLSPVTFWLTALFAIVVTILGILVLMFPADAAVEFIPTSTPIPVVLETTDTPTVIPTETPEPISSPTAVESPIPIETPQPPRLHPVASGETLFGISLRYGVSMDSIAAMNDMPVESDLQISQELLIPWPTATPPLVPVEIEVGGEKLVADPANCQIYEIQRGDTLYGIAASFNVPSDAMLAVNRLTELSVLQPGDTICIPQVIYGGELPSTPGPSPTPGPTTAPPGPELLFPVANSLVESASGIVSLQWVTVKDLAKGEWYMIELTDLSEVDSHPRRAFSRQTSFQLPDEWDPAGSVAHDIRWRISIVRVTGQREDGSFIYTFGGETSDDAIFRWIGDSG